MFGFFSKLKQTPEDRLLFSTLKGLMGVSPKNLDLYKLALRHSSVEGDSNERLEFLGDAVLGSIVADFLFKKYPFRNEGFLTEIRSRIVKRESLNQLAQRMGIDRFIQTGNSAFSSKSINGNALEALIGAIYLDRGYLFTYDFVVLSMIQPFVNVDEVVNTDLNFKSKVIEWAQKNNKKFDFRIIDTEGLQHNKTFTAQILIDDVIIGTGKAHNKKKAEQAAAEKVCKALQIP